MIKPTLSKFADDTKMSGAVNLVEGRHAIQRDLDRLGDWAHVNLMKFNNAKCKVLHLAWGNSHYQFRVEDKLTESSLAEKDLWILPYVKLYISQQCVLAAQKVNPIPVCTGRSVSSRSREVILVRSHSEYCVYL